MASKKQDPPQFMNNINYTNKEGMYRWSDRSRYSYPRKPEYKQSYTRYRPYYKSNETHFIRKITRKAPSRPSSPVLGSEEYMDRKIQQTSAIIMKHLLNPEECIPEHSKNSINNHENKNHYNEIENKKSNKTNGRSAEVSENKNKNNVTYDIEEIQKKIICHITNLNDGKKKNLVFSSTSSYDIAIQQIQKQKRLEISRALRNMCSQSETQESSDFINSIIPDIGIKIEDLPRDLIEELSNTLNLDYGSNNYEEDFLNSSSQDTGYISFSDKLNENNDFKEDLNVHSSEQEHDTDHLVLMPNTKLGEIMQNNSENFKNITIKKEMEEYPDNPHTEVSTDTISGLLSKSDEINENRNDSTVEVKQECGQFLDFEHHNEILFNETNTDLELNYSETSANYDRSLHLGNNILPINEENHNKFEHKLDISIQTDENYFYSKHTFIGNFLEANSFDQPPQCISQAVTRMLKIDECILELTKYRQTLFNNFKDTNQLSNVVQLFGSDSTKTLKKKKKRKKNKACSQEKFADTDIVKKSKIDEIKNNINEQTGFNSIHNPLTYNKSNCGKEKLSQIENSCGSIPKVKKQGLLNLQEIHEKMLIIKAVEDKLVAGSENGNIFTFSLENGHCTNTLCASDVPITALWFEKNAQQNIDMYVGCFENRLKLYDFQNQVLVKTVSIDDSIQCLESCWGYIFMGCIRGSVIRYSIKKGMVEYEDKWADDRILVIKATQEGARKILLVGSRNSPVCIKDAMTGLYMRTMENVVSPTVYSLIMEKSLIYCGTTNHDILVYSFHDGKLSNTFKAAGSKGISCLKIIKNLIFASCHNGNIYVYDMKRNTFIDSIQGPGGVILSMEVLENQVIVGTMSFKFKSLPIPQHILKCND